MLADRPDGRRLSADEQRQLDDLERRLLSGPLAPARAVPVGLAAARRLSPAERRIVLVGFAAAGALLVLAAAIGGPGGLDATATALLATMLVCRMPWRRFRLGRRWRWRWRWPRRRRG